MDEIDDLFFSCHLISHWIEQIQPNMWRSLGDGPMFAVNIGSLELDLLLLVSLRPQPNLVAPHSVKLELLVTLLACK